MVDAGGSDPDGEEGVGVRAGWGAEKKVAVRPAAPIP